MSALFFSPELIIAEVEQQQRRDSERPNRPHSTTSAETVISVEDKEKESELFQALLKSVASNNIATLQQGLAKQSIFWSGVAWVAQALEQRLSGVAAGAIDLGLVTDKLASFVSVPDAGLLRDRDAVGVKEVTEERLAAMPALPSLDLEMDMSESSSRLSRSACVFRVWCGAGTLRLMSDVLRVLGSSNLFASPPFGLEQREGGDGGGAVGGQMVNNWS